MSMMLGGDVAQILEQAAAYRSFGTSLAACGGNVVATTDGAVSALHDQVAGAQGAVEAALQEVAQESQSVTARFGGLQWTGANRTQVEEVAAELDAHVTETTVRVRELFETFRADLLRLGTELNEVAAQFNTVAANAGESASSVGQAMDSQAAHLDEVMNSGIARI